MPDSSSTQRFEPAYVERAASLRRQRRIATVRAWPLALKLPRFYAAASVECAVWQGSRSRRVTSYRGSRTTARASARNKSHMVANERLEASHRSGRKPGLSRNYQSVSGLYATTFISTLHMKLNRIGNIERTGGSLTK